jgi:hypothetical protein
MALNELLDKVIAEEVYQAVKVGYNLRYHPSQLPQELVEQLETDEQFLKRYKEQLAELLQELGHEDLEVINIDPVAHSLEIRYTAYYIGCREYPEIHLKTLLVFHEEIGVNIYDPAVFDEIVEKARRDLSAKNMEAKEARLDRFATLFKEALEQERN